MSVFVVVAAVRIQAWLRRTPDLYLLRGASEALAQVTRHAHVADRVPNSVAARIDGTAPDVDGVVVLVTDNPTDARASAEWLLGDLAGRLPAVEWRAWADEAESYVQAYERVNTRGLAPSIGRWHWPPRALDLPLGALCQGCSQETATFTVEHEGSVPLGPDCKVRFDHNRWAREPDKPKDFSDLAKSGGLGAGVDPYTVGRRDSANHLATIAADGNLMGKLFETLSTKDPVVQQAVSRAVASATSKTVDAAKSQVADGAPVSVVITHYTGGDDLLLSVPARFAWTFVEKLSLCFEEQFQNAVKTTLEQVDIGQDDLMSRARRVSLGIGLVFSHAKYPFSHASEVAEIALKQAKKAACGQYAAIAWADLTVEDRVAPGRGITRTTLSTELVPPETADDQTRQHLEILRLNSSARDALAGILREGAYASIAPAEQGKHIVRWARRTDRKLLATIKEWDEPKLRELSNVLDRARWWPAMAEAVPSTE